jgi:hypothetical protein
MHWKIDTAWISYEVVQKLQDGVSTDRDSEVESKKSEGWLYQPEVGKQEQERRPFVDKTSHGIHRSSKLVVTLSGTCWRDNCWYLRMLCKYT